MKTIVIIPARMASERFPNKPLAKINGIPMIERVWRQAIKSNVGKVYVACSEKEVFELIGTLGINILLKIFSLYLDLFVVTAKSKLFFTIFTTLSL